MADLSTNIGHAGGATATIQGKTIYHVHVVKEFLDSVNGKYSLRDAGVRKSLPLNSGGALRFTRVLNIPKVTSPLSDEVTNPTAATAKIQFIDVAPNPWGNGFEIPNWMQDVMPDNISTELAARLAENANSSYHTELGKVLIGPVLAGTGTPAGDISGAGLLISGGGISAKTTVQRLADAVVASSSTTSYKTLANLTADGFLGGVIVFIDETSKNYGQARRILAVDGTNEIIYWTTAVNTAPIANEQVLICGVSASDGTALTQGTNIFKATDLRRSVLYLDLHKAKRFGDGFYRAVLNPFSIHTLKNQTAAGEVLEVAKYTTLEPLKKYGSDFEAFGCRVVMTTERHRLDKTAATEGDYLATGDYDADFVCGEGAFGYAGLANMMDTEIGINVSGSGQTFDMLRLKRQLFWKTSFARLGINAAHAIGVVSYHKDIE